MSENAQLQVADIENLRRQQVRRLTFLQLPNRAKVNIVTNTIIDVLQIVVAIVALALGGNTKNCFLAKIFIGVYLLRLMVAFPLCFHHLLCHRDLITGDLYDDSEMLTGRIRGWCITLLPLLILPFGSFVCFSASGKLCQVESPLTYNTSLSFIIYVYQLVGFPLVILTLYFFLIIILACCGNLRPEGGEAGANNGLTSELLSMIPERIYKSPSNPNAVTGSEAQLAQDSLALADKKTDSSSAANKNEKKGTATEEKMKAAEIDRKNSIRSIDAEDATCAICLGEYVEGDKVKKLPCKHHFHADCTNQWLQKNEKCPLCMGNVREKLETIKTAK